MKIPFFSKPKPKVAIARPPSKPKRQRRTRAQMEKDRQDLLKRQIETRRLERELERLEAGVDEQQGDGVQDIIRSVGELKHLREVLGAKDGQAIGEDGIKGWIKDAIPLFPALLEALRGNSVAPGQAQIDMVATQAIINKTLQEVQARGLMAGNTPLQPDVPRVQVPAESQANLTGLAELVGQAVSHLTHDSPVEIAQWLVLQEHENAKLIVGIATGTADADIRGILETFARTQPETLPIFEWVNGNQAKFWQIVTEVRVLANKLSENLEV